MTPLLDLVADLSAASSSRLSLPEYRQIELYSKRKSLVFATGADAPPSPVAGACRAFLVLDAFLAAQTPSAGEPSTWRRYLDLPRASTLDRLVAEIYRVLRVARTVAFYPDGEIETRGGLVRIKGIVDKVVMVLDISPAGLLVLESAVAWYLDSLRQPYPAAYVEAMLSQYFHDIVDEIKRYSDEGRSLYQFQSKYPFNRHFRFDCDNPKTKLDDTSLEIVINAAQRNPALYPIDFYVTLGDALHIIPVEALADGKLPLAELERWRARLPDGVTLPASFRSRFGHEAAAVNQPMT